MLYQLVRRIIKGAIIGFMVGIHNFGSIPTSFASTNPIILTKFVTVSGASWQSLAHGAYGSGYILYYLPSRGVSHPSLVVRLARAKGDPNAIADVFDAPNGLDYVPISITDSTIVLNNVSPSIFMTAVGGWWVNSKSGMANYNLRVQISEPMYAMWGEPTYENLLPTNQPLFSIETRTDSQGNPLWDLRTLLPAMPGEGVYRTNYSQREAKSQITYVSSVSPLFPYIAYQGAYEQGNGMLVPPIVVDWENGRITDFSEVVTVRHQTSSYDFYSLSEIIKGVVNKPDFESPWGLYDLSGKGKSYPNLVIRTEHFGSLDPWSTGIDPSFIAAPLMNYPTDEIRYSWADHPGNQLFDYKVDVFGFHPYKHLQSIAGGALRVEAPAYDAYPKWVIGNKWNAITFVDTNGGGYQTSEGIYDWTARNIGNAYWRGWTSVPDFSQFQTISPGLRGEYAIGLPEQPTLYLSPIDYRLHLKNAQGGLWNLGDGLRLDEFNLNMGPYIDAWKVVRNQKVKSQFYQIDGQLVEADSSGIRVQQTKTPASTRTMLPPTDHNTWLQFSTFASKLKRKNPLQMKSWLNPRGLTDFIPDATLQTLHTMPHGFQMVITVPNGEPTSNNIAKKFHLPSRSGQFVVSYQSNSRTWSSAYANPPRPRPTVSLDEIDHKATIELANTGDETYTSQVTISIDGLRYEMPSLRLEANQSKTATLPLYPSSGPTSVKLYAGHSILYNHLFPENQYQRPSLSQILTLSVPNERVGLYELIVILILLTSGIIGLSRYPSKDEQP